MKKPKPIPKYKLKALKKLEAEKPIERPYRIEKRGKLQVKVYDYIEPSIKDRTRELRTFPSPRLE